MSVKKAPPVVSTTAPKSSAAKPQTTPAPQYRVLPKREPLAEPGRPLYPNEGHVQEHLERVSNSLIILNNLVNILGERIDPILSREPLADDSAAKETSTSVCSLADQIVNLDKQVAEITSYTQLLISRVSL